MNIFSPFVPDLPQVFLLLLAIATIILALLIAAGLTEAAVAALNWLDRQRRKGRNNRREAGNPNPK